MKLKRRHDFKAEVATASLNDIMFFLLLFFLIVATFANPKKEITRQLAGCQRQSMPLPGRFWRWPDLCVP